MDIVKSAIFDPSTYSIKIVKCKGVELDKEELTKIAIERAKWIQEVLALDPHIKIIIEEEK